VNISFSKTSKKILAEMKLFTCVHLLWWLISAEVLVGLHL